MGSTAHVIHLINSIGGRVASVQDDGNVVERFAGSIPKSRLLKVLDPYEDTVYTSSQMHAFIDEWRQLSDLIVDNNDLDFVRQVESLAELALSEPGSTLLFEGD